MPAAKKRNPRLGEDRLPLPAQRAKIDGKHSNRKERPGSMGRCREGKSAVPFDQASHKCGKCGARTADRDGVCQPQPIRPAPPPDDEAGKPS